LDAASVAREGESDMGRIGLVIGIVIVLVIVAGALFLAYSEFPAQRAPVEKVLPDARFPK
jgi:hypothetical protein